MVLFKILHFLFLSILFQHSLAQAITVNEARALFVSEANEIICKNCLYSIINKNAENNPVLIAYRGASLAMYARCTNNPGKKYQYFSLGKDDIETAVSRDSNNTDIRFVRFQIQSFLPFFLGYNNIKEDKSFLFSRIYQNIKNQTDLDFTKIIILSMLESNSLEVPERIKLQQYLDNNFK
jgi:hypothetical protein